MITIIGILIALLLPAVQAAREAARKLQCANNLKQISLAALGHEEVLGWLPTGGWGHRWVGDPDCGFGKEQPAGFLYNILPWMEQQSLHDLGVGMGQGSPSNEKGQLGLLMIQTPLSMLNCPTRRQSAVYPVRSERIWELNAWKPSDLNVGWFRSCYSCNGGSYLLGWGWGPSSWALAAAAMDLVEGNGFYDMSDSNGISNQRSKITLAEILDGTSNTYMAGEKHLNPDHYFTGEDWGDDEPAFSGDDVDICRWTYHVPRQDTPGSGDYWSFGSAHSGSLNMAFCDGSVKPINYTINLAVHRNLGNRRDGCVIDAKEF